MIVRLTAVMITLFAFSSCSIMFSPTVNMPPEPMQKEDVSLTAGGGAFPSFRALGGDMKTAYEAEVGYGFSDKFALRLKSWNDFGFLGDGSTLWGAAASAIIMVYEPASEFRLGLIPVAGFTADGSEITAGGFELHLGMWMPDFYFIKPRISVGTIYGTRDLGDNDWGIGGSANLALSADITDYLYLNLEAYFVSIYRNSYGYYTYFGSVIFGVGFYL